MHEGLTKLVDRLLHDVEFADEFREAPADCAAEYGVQGAELDAVLAGEEEGLLAAGLDPELITKYREPRVTSPLWVWALATRTGNAVLAAAAALVLLFSAATPAYAIRADNPTGVRGLRVLSRSIRAGHVRVLFPIQTRALRQSPYFVRAIRSGRIQDLEISGARALEQKFGIRVEYGTPVLSLSLDAVDQVLDAQ